MGLSFTLAQYPSSDIHAADMGLCQSLHCNYEGFPFSDVVRCLKVDRN